MSLYILQFFWMFKMLSTSWSLQQPSKIGQSYCSTDWGWGWEIVACWKLFSRWMVKVRFEPLTSWLPARAQNEPWGERALIRRCIWKSDREAPGHPTYCREISTLSDFHFEKTSQACHPHGCENMLESWLDGISGACTVAKYNFQWFMVAMSCDYDQPVFSFSGGVGCVGKLFVSMVKGSIRPPLLSGYQP